MTIQNQQVVQDYCFFLVDVVIIIFAGAVNKCIVICGNRLGSYQPPQAAVFFSLRPFGISKSQIKISGAPEKGTPVGISGQRPTTEPGCLISGLCILDDGGLELPAPSSGGKCSIH